LRMAVLLKAVPPAEENPYDVGSMRMVRDQLEVNPFDLVALEGAVQLKERHGGEVVVLSMGPQGAEGALREAMARGADRAVLISDEALSGSDLRNTAMALESALRRLGPFDLILSGERSSDGNMGVLGAYLAARLGLPLLPQAVSLPEVEGGHVVAPCDAGEVLVLKAPLPAVVVASREMAKPRLPSLKDKMRAKKSPIERLDCASLGFSPLPNLRLVGVDPMPQKPRERRILKGMDSFDEFFEALRGVMGS